MPTEPPFPPAWESDPHSGHHRSCAIRVKIDCTCGQSAFAKRRVAEEAARGIRADLPLAFEYLHNVLHLPPDVHIVGVSEDPNTTPDLGNLLIHLEAFSDGTFPGARVTAQFHEDWNVKTGRRDVIFDGWESVD